MIFTVVTMPLEGYNKEQFQQLVNRALILRAQGKRIYYAYDEPGPDQTIVWKRQWDTLEDAQDWIVFVRSIADPIEVKIIDI